MISRDEILMGRDKEYPLNQELENNLKTLLLAVNKFRTLYGLPMTVSSGYRPGKYNSAAGGAKTSSHLTLQAVDFKDADGKIKAFILKDISILEKCGLYMEHQDATPTWCHLQIRPTKNRIFKP